MILQHARLLLPDGECASGWLRWRKERIVEVGAGESPQSDEEEVFDCAGSILAPGFIDLHVHGALGRDFMEASPEAFATVLGHHLAGGTTSLAPTSTSAPWSSITDFLAEVRRWRTRAKDGFPAVLGAHLEGPFLSREQAGAQDGEFFRLPQAGELADSTDVLILTLAPCLPGAGAAIRALTARGVRVSLGHTAAWDEVVAEAVAAGATRVTHWPNAMSAARRRGVYRVAGLLECALADPALGVELIADGHHVSPTLLRLAMAAKGLEGAMLVSDATAASGLAEGSAFTLGRRACVVHEGVGMLADRSALAGSATRLLDGVRTLVRKCGVPLWQAVRLASWAPAQSIGLHDRGALAPGLRADLVLLDSDLNVRQVFVGGRSAFRFRS